MRCEARAEPAPLAPAGLSFRAPASPIGFTLIARATESALAPMIHGSGGLCGSDTQAPGGREA